MTPRNILLLSIGWLATCGLPAHAGGLEPEPLTLRVQDAVALPGSVAAIVIRTYASRPIRQGQICFISRLLRQPGAGAALTTVPATARKSSHKGGGLHKGGGGGPFTELLGARVFSVADDTAEQAIFEPGGQDQTVTVQFASTSATINAADGPMMVLYFRLRNDVNPDQRFSIDIDLGNTALIDADGIPIDYETRGGELRIRAPFESVNLGISAEEPLHNQVMLTLQTDELFAISSGQFGFHYPSTLLRGKPKVTIEQRYGNATWSVDYLRGLIVVRFDSPDHTLNLVPGDIVWLSMHIDDVMDPGVDRTIWLDPVHTFVYDSNGTAVDLDLEADVIP